MAGWGGGVKEAKSASTEQLHIVSIVQSNQSYCITIKQDTPHAMGCYLEMAATFPIHVDEAHTCPLSVITILASLMLSKVCR